MNPSARNLLFLLSFATATSHAQVDPSYESLFHQSFEGMFAAPDPRLVLGHRVMEPNPPVPLDGGIVLLLVGGAVLARKRITQ